MKFAENIKEVAVLQPDYLGFIFHEKSARFFDGIIPELPKNIKKVGVFVNETVESILEKIKNHHLQVIQLHGNESVEFCHELRNRHSEFISESHFKIQNQIPFDSKLEIIKVFAIKDTFDFSVLTPYEAVCDFFLFDTKGKLPGGNGYTFNWDILKDYNTKKPFFLSGGIGVDQMGNLKKFQQSDASKYCFAIDVNSKFEIKPGLKNTKLLKEFKS